ncbi:CAP domain-containing protein [Streptomyces paradoxus]|uniref:CAP domain-containing protein n=1 Tax=Streptomyces paradoxus TaxID=66375 RepID=UPI0037D52FC4
MRRTVLALAATLLAWSGPPVPVPPHYEVPRWPLPAPGPVHAPQGDSAAAEVAAAVNRYRGRTGCGPVRLRASLNRAAQTHSADMARRQYLTHTGADGSGPAARMRAAGYHPSHSAENIAAGPATPEAAVRTWIDSRQHRAIILTCRYVHAGVGVAHGGAGPWWTLDLATGH